MRHLSEQQARELADAFFREQCGGSIRPIQSVHHITHEQLDKMYNEAVASGRKLADGEGDSYKKLRKMIRPNWVVHYESPLGVVECPSTSVCVYEDTDEVSFLRGGL